MSTFKNHAEVDHSFSAFVSSIEAVIQRLSGPGNEKDMQLIQSIKDQFIIKTNDFFRDNRKLNIGVVGQVKAGKSSFLNTLLFGGAEVLPKASTPKTATLTKIEYAEVNRIHVEYYSPEEWEAIEDNAAVDDDNEIFQTAREIIGMVTRSGLEPHAYLEQGFEEKQFDSYENLMSSLNEYVGENGRFTPIVKAVTLYMNKEELKDISIVDTPGLNDPIVSRTIRTKEFMEVCDVVFFLSQTGSFLDKSDWTLLSSQLPQKGVKKLVLVASKYDSGIRDVLKHKDEDDVFDEFEDDNTADNIPQACQIISKKLSRRARSKVIEFTNDLRRRGASPELINVLEQCQEPILVSSMCHNISSKSAEQYNAEEMNVFRALRAFSSDSDIASDLRLLSNIDRIQAIYDTVVAEKEEILSQKAKSFIPTAVEELKQRIAEIREKAEKKLSLISGSDREQLLEQQRMIENQMAGIRSEVVTVFGELYSRLETEKAEAVRELRQASKEYGTLTERTGTEVKTGSRTYSTSKWYNPFSWGKTETEYYSYDVSYSYLAVSDALDNLRTYSTEALNEVEKVFTDAIQLKEMKRKLLNVLINNFDMGSEKYDFSLFRILVEEQVKRIEYPVFKLDISEATDQLASKFNGQVRSDSQKAGLHQAMLSAVSQLFERITYQLADTVRHFKSEMSSISEQLMEGLLKDIHDEFNMLLEQLQHREQEIENYRNYIYLLTSELKQL